MQIRAGTGGEEAALFASELLRMYQKYAELQNWKLVAVSESQAENGGLKEAFVEVIAPAAGPPICVLYSCMNAHKQMGEQKPHCQACLPWDAAQCWPCLLPPQSWINASAVAHAVGPSKLTSCRCPISCWARQIQAIFNQPWAQAQYLHRLRPSGAEECCCVLHR
jgi:hypothetical protein